MPHAPNPINLTAWARTVAELRAARQAANPEHAGRVVREIAALGLAAAGPRAALATDPVLTARIRNFAEGLLLDPRGPTDAHGLRTQVVGFARRAVRDTTLPETALLRPLARRLDLAAPRADAAPALAEIRTILGLSDPELARVLGVTRQALEQWRRRGVPARRAADVDRLAAAARWLADELIGERIPQLVRVPVPALGGRTMLDYATAAGPLAWLEHLATLFSMQSTA